MQIALPAVPARFVRPDIGPETAFVSPKPTSGPQRASSETRTPETERRGRDVPGVARSANFGSNCLEIPVTCLIGLFCLHTIFSVLNVGARQFMTILYAQFA